MGEQVAQGSLDGRIRLVASDIDGTLIFRDGPQAVDERVLACIRELARRGVPFVASSGRPYANLRRIFEPVAEHVLCLCENGTLVMGGDGPLLQRGLPRDEALAICHEIMAYPGASPLVNCIEAGYVLESTPWLADLMHKRMGTPFELVARPEDVAADILKVAFYIEPELLDAAFEYFTRLFEGRFAVTVSGLHWIDVLPLGVNKGTAMAALGRELGIEVADMAAFGDNLNDAELLDLVGHPFLMASGRIELRSLNERIRVCESVHGELERLLACEGAIGC